jgi:hypothetical protein
MAGSKRQQMNTEPEVAAASSCEEVPLPLGYDCGRAIAEDRLRPASLGASAKGEGPKVRSEGGFAPGRRLLSLLQKPH